MGIDQSAVSRIEAGRRRLSADELQRFADALHVSADVLLKGAAEAPAARPGPAHAPAAAATSLDDAAESRFSGLDGSRSDSVR